MKVSYTKKELYEKITDYNFMVAHLKYMIKECNSQINEYISEIELLKNELHHFDYLLKRGLYDVRGQVKRTPKRKRKIEKKS